MGVWGTRLAATGYLVPRPVCHKFMERISRHSKVVIADDVVWLASSVCDQMSKIADAKTCGGNG